MFLDAIYRVDISSRSTNISTQLSEKIETGENSKQSILLSDSCNVELVSSPNVREPHIGCSYETNMALSLEPDTETSFDTHIKEIESHELSYEKVPVFCSSTILSGYRVIDFGYVLNQLSDMFTKHFINCQLGNLFLRNERRKGLHSILQFSCNKCSYTYQIHTEKEERINKAMVWGTVCSGSTYTQIDCILSSMDVPMATDKTFTRIERLIGKTWQEMLSEDIALSGNKEYELAISQNKIVNNVGLITVYVDGGWSKRSYGHNFNANSGVVCYSISHIPNLMVY